jgi:hypothetical protein
VSKKEEFIKQLEKLSLAPDFSLGFPRLKPRVIIMGYKFLGFLLLAPDFSLGLPRLKPRVKYIDS